MLSFFVKTDNLKGLELIVLKRISLYAIGKYIELGALAFLSFHLAFYVGPQAFASITIPMLIITYSALIMTGLNQAYMKHFSLESEPVNHKRLTSFIFCCNLIASLIVCLFVLIFYQDKLVFYVSLIAPFNVIRGAIQNTLRTNIMPILLAIFNLFLPIIFASFYFLNLLATDSVDIESYFQAWFIGIVSSSLVGIIIIIRASLISVSLINDFLIMVKERGALILIDGLKLSSLSILVIVFLSVDRLILANSSIASVLMGNYQFAETLSNVYYMGITSFLFMLSPVYLRKLKEGDISVERFIVLAKLAFVLLSVGYFIFVGFCYLLIQFVYFEYAQAMLPLLGIAASKTLLAILFFPVTLLTVINRENSIVRYYAMFAMLSVAGQLIFVNFYENTAFIYLPVVNAFCILMTSCSLMWFIRNQKESIEQSLVDIRGVSCE